MDDRLFRLKAGGCRPLSAAGNSGLSLADRLQRTVIGGVRYVKLMLSSLSSAYPTDALPTE